MIAANEKTERILIRDIKYQNKEEALRAVGADLCRRGYVKPSFCKGILSREAVYPTGLPIGAINVAIPHTDAEHVLKPAMAVVILDDPLEFHVMGNSEKTVPVDILFVLALKSADSQLQTLQELMRIIQDEDRLVKIKGVKTALELDEVLSA